MELDWEGEKMHLTAETYYRLGMELMLSRSLMILFWTSLQDKFKLLQGGNPLGQFGGKVSNATGAPLGTSSKSSLNLKIHILSYQT